MRPTEVLEARRRWGRDSSEMPSSAAIRVHVFVVQYDEQCEIQVNKGDYNVPEHTH